MRKWLIWFLVFLLSLFPIFKEQPLIAHANFGGGAGSVSSAPLPTRAEGTDIPTTNNGALCAMANVLTWEILQTYLYAVTGQQAYDIYGNDSEKQESLYADFATFCEEMGYGTNVMFEFNRNMAYIGSVNLKQTFEYYKTAGTSALKEMQEDAKAQMQVIYGGLSNNVSPAPSPTTGAIGVGKKQFCELLGTGALTKYIGNYITQLVNGERGEVSETFLNIAGNSDMYFDGGYKIENGYYQFGTTGKCYQSTYYPENEWAIKMKYNPEKYCRPCIFWFKETTLNSHTDPVVQLVHMRIIVRDLIFYPYTDDGNLSLSKCIDNYGYTGNYDLVYGSQILHNPSDITIPMGNMAAFSGIPVFQNFEDALQYMIDGDATHALNWFEGTSNPDNWLNYDFSQISDKLDQILQALTTLPTITTDDLAGFAQGVGNAVVAGNVPALDPATQQQQMQQILEDTARDTATRSLANSAMGSETESGGDDDTPRPTKTVEEYENDQTIQNGTMVVDWHEFFPFCVPYDMVRLIKVLNAEPQAPCFETAIKYDKLNINVPVKLDLSQFDEAAEVFRLCETILFILGLILVTRNLIRG